MSEYIKREDAIKAVCMKCKACIGKRTLECGEARALLALPAANVAKRSHWIPMAERLPENDCHCLCVFTDGTVGEAHFFASNGKFYAPVEDYDRYYATHWMPLPDPPKEDE